MKLSVFIALCFSLSATALEEAEPCDKSMCPGSSTCRCSSTDTPGDLDVRDVPQFVVLSFDDGITTSNHPFYTDLASGFKNPNGCNIKMTFFVSHQNSDYRLVNDLHRNGHEIAVHSVTHKADVENYWRKLDKEEWKREMEDQRSMLARYGNIPEEDIKGFRAPFLEVGGDSMYEALQESGFEYDCSWPSLHYTPWFRQPDNTIKGALWPYTLDYQSIQDQTVGTKPKSSFPGLWVAPMTDMYDHRLVECSMLDACLSAKDELEKYADAVTDLLKQNFKAHYQDKRTPFGVYVHHSWFLHDDITNTTVRRDGFKGFLNYLKALPDVYVVSVRQMLDWVKNPVKVSAVGNLDSFRCDTSLPVDNCPDTDGANCEYTKPLPINQTSIYMGSCKKPCPPNYPYLNNVDGMNVNPEA